MRTLDNYRKKASAIGLSIPMDHAASFQALHEVR